MKNIWLWPASKAVPNLYILIQTTEFWFSSQIKRRLSVKITTTTLRVYSFTERESIQDKRLYNKQAFWKCAKQSSGCKNRKYQLPNHCWNWDIRKSDWIYPGCSVTHQANITMYDWPPRCKKKKKPVEFESTPTGSLYKGQSKVKLATCAATMLLQLVFYRRRRGDILKNHPWRILGIWS